MKSSITLFWKSSRSLGCTLCSGRMRNMCQLTVLLGSQLRFLICSSHFIWQRAEAWEGHTEFNYNWFCTCKQAHKLVTRHCAPWQPANIAMQVEVAMHMQQHCVRPWCPHQMPPLVYVKPGLRRVQSKWVCTCCGGSDRGFQRALEWTDIWVQLWWGRARGAEGAANSRQQQGSLPVSCEGLCGI